MPYALKLSFINPLSFPASRSPGFDPTHPAVGGLRGDGGSSSIIMSRGNGFSLVAIGANFIDLLGSVVTAANTGKGIQSTLGPFVSFTGQTQNCQLSGQLAASNISGTYGAIIYFIALGAGYQTFISAQANDGSLVIAAHGSNFIVYGNGDTAALPISAAVPYFLGATIRHTATTNFYDTVATNLLTGKITSASQATGTGGFVNSSLVWIGNQNNATTQFSNARIAAVMYGPSGISKQALLAWALDPWSFWYPRKGVGRDIFSPLVGVSAAKSLSADRGVFSLSGIANSLLASRRASLTNGAFALNGQAATTKKGSLVSATNGAFALTGEAITLKATRALSAADGSFALNGQANTLRAARSLQLADGIFTIASEATTLKAARVLSAADGLFVLTGEAVTLRATRTMTAADGVFVLTGEAVTLTQKLANRILPDAGLFLLTGEAVSLLAKRRLLNAQGVFSLVGEAVSLAHGYRLTAVEGLFSLVGEASVLRATRRLLNAQGNFAVSGQGASVLKGSRLSAAQGLFSLTGETISIQAGYTIIAQRGAFSVAGEAVTLRAVRVMQLAPGIFLVLGEDAALARHLPSEIILHQPSLWGQDYAPGEIAIVTPIVDP